MVLSAMDTLLITADIVIGGGFKSFTFLAYNPALALLVVVFTSLWFGLAWTTMTTVAYTLICLTVGPGLNLDEDHEKLLLVRVAAMYAMVLWVSLITRFERTRRQAALERERQLHRERVDLSGVDGRSGRDRRAVEVGHVGAEAPHRCGSHLRGQGAGTRPVVALCGEGRITGIPARMTQSGTEPALATEMRARLFSIAHNALTNACLHAHPGGVEVGLEFETDRVRLSVSDDGAGLPDDYGERGRGFKGMNADAERLGGSLVVALWVIDSMLDARILSVLQVVAALEAMRNDPRCPVPKPELAARIPRLRV